MTTPDTCLFTGEVLNSTTKEEHTIPQSIGGRIKSTQVSSSNFNEKCGSAVDHILAQTYKNIFGALAPALPACVDPGEIIYYDNTGSKFVLKSGLLDIKKSIFEKDKNGNVIGVTCNKKQLPKILRSLNCSKDDTLTEEIKIETVPLYYPNIPLVTREGCISALKSVLLTFDHFLIKSPEKRFTRTSELKNVREFVYDEIYKPKTRSIEDFNKYYLGVQVKPKTKDVIPLILKKLNRTINPFEHVMIASANIATKTIDVLWDFAGIETLGFRLCCNWEGNPFTYVIINPILKSQSVSSDFTLDYHDLYCAPGLGPSACSSTVNFDVALTSKIISGNHMDAYKKALDYVEFNCDDFVKDAIAEKARQKFGSSNDLRTAIKEQILGFYSPDDKTKSKFISILNEYSDSWKAWADVEINNESDFNKPELDQALVEYRKCLTGIKKLFGDPGYIFSDSIKIGSF